MTVAELIEFLKVCNPDDLVVSLRDDSDIFKAPTSIEDHTIHEYIHGGPCAWRIAFQEEIAKGDARKGIVLV